MFSGVDVVIPTKSNLNGMLSIVSVLEKDPLVRHLYVVSDGESAVSRTDNPRVTSITVPEGSGIHVMWNLALTTSDGHAHVLFLNDDVTVYEDTLKGMSSTLDTYPELGLVCPTYAPESFEGDYREVDDICGGRYDGSGGLAGFCMMLSKSLTQEWRFDERMKWWYGDNEIVAWTRCCKKRKVAICSGSTCSNNSSWTITNDPPKSFIEDITRDGELFREKWSNHKC